MNQWDPTTADFPTVSQPQAVVPPMMYAAPGTAATTGIPGWVQALAVIVSVLKALPVLLLVFAIVVLASEFGAAEFGVVVAAIFVIPLAMLFIQAYTALSKRRLGLQITSGLLLAFDLLVLVVALTDRSSEGAFLLAIAPILQAAVFVGSVTK